jgi:hypothetical protein
MFGSPNYIRGIYDGSTTLNPFIQPFSARISQHFRNFFDYKKLKWINIDLSTVGGDWIPFADANIPVGGMLSGTTHIKSTRERDLFGGIAQAYHDPCHHLPCDTLKNVNRIALEELSKATADLVERLLHLEKN